MHVKLPKAFFFFSQKLGGRHNKTPFSEVESSPQGSRESAALQEIPGFSQKKKVGGGQAAGT